MCCVAFVVPRLGASIQDDGISLHASSKSASSIRGLKYRNNSIFLEMGRVCRSGFYFPLGRERVEGI